MRAAHAAAITIVVPEAAILNTNAANNFNAVFALRLADVMEFAFGFAVARNLFRFLGVHAREFFPRVAFNAQKVVELGMDRLGIAMFGALNE
jgi:hypothetical protein